VPEPEPPAQPPPDSPDVPEPDPDAPPDRPEPVIPPGET
jgi:hypothetical protein